VSSSRAISKGASVVEKLVTRCGRPSSKTVKFSARRFATGRPARSRTTTGTGTSCVSTRSTSSSPTSTGAARPSVGFASGVRAGCAA
jgi:hypothetical protein